MKQGLLFENGELIYYKNGQPHHAGVIKENGAIYYIGSGGKAVKGRHVVHREMANDLLKRGTYTFGEDYKLVKGSYKAPKKIKKKRKKFKLPSVSSAKRSLRNRLRALRADKKAKKKLAITAVAVAFGLLICIALPFMETLIHESRNPVTTPSSTDGPSSTNAVQSIILPEFKEDVLLCSTAAKAEYDGEITLEESVNFGDPYRPFLFEYHFLNTSGRLLLSTDPTFADAREYFMPESDTVVQIDNLYTDTTYYYKVFADSQEYTGTFHTAPSTRFVSIPGLINTRDIGGRTTLDGKVVKQGMLIRGVEIDGFVNPTYFIPTEDIPTVQETFGFVYDLDLREQSLYSGKYTSRLGVPHKFYTSPQYGQIFNAGYKNSLKNIFSDLANPDNYPMYLHCTWGTDRTGTIIFLLQGILNMSEEDMVREYRLTAYCSKSLSASNNMEGIIYGLSPYEGDTLQEKIVTYLTTVIGVTDEEIASIRDIFLAK